VTFVAWQLNPIDIFWGMFLCATIMFEQTMVQNAENFDESVVCFSMSRKHQNKSDELETFLSIFLLSFWSWHQFHEHIVFLQDLSNSTVRFRRLMQTERYNIK